MRRWDRFCTKCFQDLDDDAVHCNKCGQNYAKLHIKIIEIHPKSGLGRRDRKLWTGQTGDFILETDYSDVKNSPIPEGWCGGYFIPDGSPTQTMLLNAIDYDEVPKETSSASLQPEEPFSSAQVNREPLVDAGKVDHSGQLIGGEHRAFPALKEVRPATGAAPRAPAVHRVMGEQLSTYTCSKCGKVLEETGIDPGLQRLKQAGIISIAGFPAIVISDPYLYRGTYCTRCNKAFCPDCSHMQIQTCPECGQLSLTGAYRPLLTIAAPRAPAVPRVPDTSAQKTAGQPPVAVKTAASSKDPVVAGLLNWFLFGGGGYIYLGQIAKGIVTILIVLATIPLIFGAFIPILTCIDSYKLARRLKEGRPIKPWEFLWDRPASVAGRFPSPPYSSVPVPKSEPAKDTAQRRASKTADSPTSARAFAIDQEYVRRCLEPGFTEDMEARVYNSDPAFKTVIDPLNAGDNAMTCRNAEALIPAFSDFDNLYVWWGKALMRMGSFDKARQVLQEGLGKAKRKFSLCATLGELEWKAGDTKQAVYWLAQALHCQESLEKQNYGGANNVYLHLYYIAEGFGLPDCSSAFLSRVDQIQAGKIRLVADVADSLIRISRSARNTSAPEVLKGLVDKYIVIEMKAPVKADPAEVDRLIAQLKKRDSGGWSSDENVEAAKKLGELGDPRALLPLTEASHDLLIDLSAAASEAIRKIKEVNR
jgi:tetratricopeptide (TPR) repeat protein